MTDQVQFFVGLVVGIGPALLLLWFSLRRFDRPFTEYTLFDDRKVFTSLAVGMIFGAVASWMETTNLAGFTGTILALAAYFVFEESFKLVWLNRKAFQGRFDTTFYGVAVGAGVASTSVVAAVVIQAPSTLYSSTAVLLVLLSIGYCFVHADTGAILGFGSSRGDMLGSFVKALAVRFAFGFLSIPFLLTAGMAPDPTLLALALAGLGLSLGLAAIVYHYVYTRLLPGTLPDDIRRDMRREKRRAGSVKD